MEVKFVILYHKYVEDKIYTGGDWRTVFKGNKVIHESKPMSNYPIDSKLEMFVEHNKPMWNKDKPMEYDFVTVEKRYYHAE
ncbi:hypothetical protein MG295_00105 [Bacillus phage vB_BcgM]|nr:hypothetical protein MG295_00105 [Bacillus phage vB_BcgM]